MAATGEKRRYQEKIDIFYQYKLVREGRIPSQKIGRHWRFRKGAIDLWLDETRVNKPELGTRR
jgi:hypothetical protein